MNDMNYCMKCGHHLTLHHQKHEGEQPYCSHCQAFRYPPFSVAVSLVVVHPDKENVLLIQQYGRSSNILVAGYIDAGETAEESVNRELMEEIGLKVKEMQYLKSEYFPKTNTLMLSYTVLVQEADLSNVSTWEVDRAEWFSFEDAIHAIRPDSLAQRFLLNFLECRKQHQILFL